VKNPRIVLNAIHTDESGHAQPAIATLAAAIGGVVLGIGAAADSDIAAIIGGVVLGLGILAAGVLNHMTVDYDMYDRLEKLEGKK
jgi:hypothetical protein